MLFVFAMTAAAGNALFAAAQKKAVNPGSSLVFIGLSAVVCLILTFAAVIISGGGPGIMPAVKTDWKWILASGAGLFLTYFGFNLLYSNFGTTSYIFYAVLSIITTSVIVGIFIFRETFNIYHAVSLLLALAAIAFFSLGNKNAG